MLDGYGDRMCSLKTKQKTWEAMSAGERDGLIAVTVFGWTRCQCGEPECAKGFAPGRAYTEFFEHYTTSLPAAFEVLGKFSDWKIERSEHGYGVFIGQNDDFDVSLPVAICRCALRAKGVEV